jgi:cell division transport system permease protein
MVKTNRTRRKKPSSGPVILSIMAVLYLFGLFGILWFAADKLSSYLKENVQVTAYFTLNTPLEQQQQTIASISEWPEVLRVEYISQEEAAAQFRDDLGENFLDVIGSNPLPASLQIYLHSSGNSKALMQEIEPDLLEMEGIYEVVAQLDLIESIEKNRKVGSLLLLSLLALFVIIAILLINNTVRLAVYSKRFLIRSMQLVGATEWFITKPFIGASIVNSLIGGLLASGLYLATAYGVGRWMQVFVFNNSITFFSREQLLKDAPVILLIILTGLLLGVLIAGLSTYISTRKYIYSRIDDLY